MANFASWYYNNDKKVDASQSAPEKAFFDVVGIKIPSLKAFISWLILRGHIKSIVKVNNKKPTNLLTLPIEQKINYLVKNLKNIEKLAKEYNKIFGENPSESK
jgi:hypothetical protein